jgi:predicted secreted protein with PEFG-CTERM motif
MKSHLLVFTLSAILITGIGMAPAFGQIQSSIVVTTDKSSYSEGETIIVTGEVRDQFSGTPVSLIVKNDNAIVFLDQITVGADKKFSAEVTAGGTMNTSGTYTVEVTHGTKQRVATTTFEFDGSTSNQTPIDPSTQITDTTVSVEGSTDLITYKITGGKITAVMPDVNANSLIIAIDATDDGSLTITIPRSVLLAETNGEDDDLFILIDGEEVDFDETMSSTDRTLIIPFQTGAETIEIIGTWVVPEFGTIAAMILAVAIISIIAVSAKSRLSIIPRY